MKQFEKIDLHMHTNISDGTDSPAEIIKHVVDAGIGLFAITDHDAMAGALEAEHLLQDSMQKKEELKKNVCTSSQTLLLQKMDDSRIVPASVSKEVGASYGSPALQMNCGQTFSKLPENLKFLRGIELSCRDEHGKYHILGYQYHPSEGPLHPLVQNAHELRRKKCTIRLEFLKTEFGIAFPPEEEAALFQNFNPGKPHIAKLLIAHGYADSISDAMKRYLNKKKIPEVYLHPEKAIQAILGSGGIPVLAHPAYGDGDQLILSDEMDQRIRYLMDFGLQGMEGYYSAFTPKIQEEMLALAERYNLYVTAGSDYHGANKLVQLGDTNLPSVQDAVPGLHAFLHAALER